MDQRIVPFSAIDSRLLGTPAEDSQPASQIMGMIINAKLHENQGPDAAQRPAIRVKSGLQSALSEQVQDILPLLPAQAWRPAWERSVLQTPPIPLMILEMLSPFADSHTADAQLARDFCLGQAAGLQQPPSFQATFFALTASEVLWWPYHGRPV